MIGDLSTLSIHTAEGGATEGLVGQDDLRLMGGRESGRVGGGEKGFKAVQREENRHDLGRTA